MSFTPKVVVVIVVALGLLLYVGALIGTAVYRWHEPPQPAQSGPTEHQRAQSDHGRLVLVLFAEPILYIIVVILAAGYLIIR